MVRPVVRTSVALALIILATACDYSSDLTDCRVACSAASPDCPAGFSCRTSEGLCRPPAASPSCASILGDAAVDTRPVDAVVDAPQAVIVFDAASNATVTNLSTMTWQHTVGANLTGSLLVVGVSIEKSGAAVQSITFAAAPMAKAAVSVGGSNTRAELWYLIAPQPGTHPVVVTFSPAVGSDGAVAGAVSLAGVDQSTPVPTTMTGGGTSATNPSTAISTANNNAWIIDVVMLDSSMKMVTATTGQMQRWNQATNPGSNGVTGAGSTRATTARGAYTMSWFPNPSSDNWAEVVAEIKP
jgi:hypothetical protein